MIEIPIEANICEIGGAYYPVKLHAVPRVGELINLFSFIDQRDDFPPNKNYEVVQVIHELHDAHPKIKQSKDGCHCVTVFVKPSKSKFFKQSDPLPSSSARN